MSQGADIRVAFIAETTFGTTPATPTFQVMRVTSSGMRLNKQTVMSEEIRSDRNIVDEMQVGVSITGSLPFEFSHASFDDMIQAALGGTWATNVVQNGTTRRSFTFEETYQFVGSQGFRRFTGCQINTLELNLQARQRITGSIGLVGINETTGTAAIAGATYTAPNTETPLTASANVGTIAFGAITAQIMSLTLQVNNNLRERPVVGSLVTDSFGAGMCEVTGQVEAYFRSLDLYNAAVAHNNVALTVTFGEAAKRYTILVPRAVLGSPETPPAGQTSDVRVRVPFRGTLSGGRSIQITRLVA